MPILRIWLYRLGLSRVDANFHRAVVSETYLATAAPGGSLLAPFRGIAQGLRRPFGNVAGLTYDNWNTFSNAIYPVPQVIEPMQTFRSLAAPPLNVNAPEAAFRLQRVGLVAAGSKGTGRLCYPILNDSHYTDLPHRRHVDLVTLAPLLAANLQLRPKVFTLFGVTYTNVIFNRSTHTWTPLDHYDLLENPVRIWQRWRIYDVAHRATSDAAWTGPFF